MGSWARCTNIIKGEWPQDFLLDIKPFLKYEARVCSWPYLKATSSMIPTDFKRTSEVRISFKNGERFKSRRKGRSLPQTKCCISEWRVIYNYHYPSGQYIFIRTVSLLSKQYGEAPCPLTTTDMMPNCPPDPGPGPRSPQNTQLRTINCFPPSPSLHAE